MEAGYSGSENGMYYKFGLEVSTMMMSVSVSDLDIWSWAPISSGIMFPADSLCS